MVDLSYKKKFILDDQRLSKMLESDKFFEILKIIQTNVIFLINGGRQSMIKRKLTLVFVGVLFSGGVFGAKGEVRTSTSLQKHLNKSIDKEIKDQVVDVDKVSVHSRAVAGEMLVEKHLGMVRNNKYLDREAYCKELSDSLKKYLTDSLVQAIEKPTVENVKRYLEVTSLISGVAWKIEQTREIAETRENAKELSIPSGRGKIKKLIREPKKLKIQEDSSTIGDKG